jgi:hypothetical protein
MARGVLLLPLKAISTVVASAFTRSAALSAATSVLAVYLVMSRTGLVDRYPF